LAVLNVYNAKKMAKSANLAGKQKRLADIALMLEQGIERKEIVQKVAKSCKASTRAIDNWIKEAKLIVLERNKKVEEAVTELSIQKGVERQNKAILTKDEALEVLTKIANDPLKETQNGVASAKTEQINAIKTIAELLGWVAPKKQEIEIDTKTIKVVRE